MRQGLSYTLFASKKRDKCTLDEAFGCSFFGVELNTNLYLSRGSIFVTSFVSTIGGIKVTLPLCLPLCRIEAAEQFGGACSVSYGGSDVVISVCISCKSI